MSAPRPPRYPLTAAVASTEQWIAGSAGRRGRWRQGCRGAAAERVAQCPLRSPVRSYDPKSAAPGGSPLVLRHRFVSQRRARKSTRPAVGSANTT